MSEPTVIQLSRPEVYVNCLSFGGIDAIACSLSTNYIHVVDLNVKKSKHVFDIAQNVVGAYFQQGGVIKAVDQAFGIHSFDARSGSKKKARLNPTMENHFVTCAAVSDKYIALGSSNILADEITEKAEKKAKKEAKKKEERGDSDDDDDDDDDDDNDEVDADTAGFLHAITIFDVRGSTDPLLTIKESHSDRINTLSFMKDGRHLISGGADGLMNVFDVSLSKEDDAIQSTIQVESSVSKVAALSKRLMYGITDDNKCVVCTPNKPDDIDTLFRRSARENRNLVDILKGGEEERPVAMIECEMEGKLSLSSLSVDGKRADVVEEWTGHTDIVRSCAYNSGILVTGGEDGKLVVKNIDLRSGGGKTKSEKKKKDRPAPI